MKKSTKINIFNLSIYKKHLYITIIFCISLLLSFSCKNEEDSLLGINFMQDSDNINCELKTFDVNCSSMLVDSIVNTKTYCSVGSFNDPIFGFVKANLAFQIKPSQTKVDFSKVTEIIGFELLLRKYSCYGDSTATQNFKIYRLLKDLDDSKTYYSNYQINSSDIELIAEVPVTCDTLIKISLPMSLAEEFMATNNSHHFDSDTTFKKFFKGIYITSSDDFSAENCIYTVQPTHTNSKMVLKYKVDAEQKSFEFLVDSKMALFSTLSHDFASAQQGVKDAIANTATQNAVCYVQGLGGIKTKLNFLGLDTIFSNKRISINRAKLILHIKNEDISSYSSPNILYLVSMDNVGTQLLIPDILASSNIYDGKYNSSSKTYSFNITTKIQTMLKSENIQDLYIIPAPERNIASPHRVAFFGNSGDENKASLEIYYSYR